MIKKIVLHYAWYFENEDFFKQLEYFLNRKYEIHAILFGSVKYDFSERFNPKVFYGPFFGPYGKWFSLINPDNIIYDYEYLGGFKQFYTKLNLPIDRFVKNKENSYIEHIEKLKIFGYLDNELMSAVYRTANS